MVKTFIISHSNLSLAIYSRISGNSQLLIKITGRIAFLIKKKLFIATYVGVTFSEKKENKNSTQLHIFHDQYNFRLLIILYTTQYMAKAHTDQHPIRYK